MTATAQKRVRRTEEQLIADLKARIASIEAQAARKKVQRNPALKHVSAALRSIDKALAASDDATMRQALGEARTIISSCLSFSGVLMPSRRINAGPRGERSRGHAEDMTDTLLDYVRKHPGQRGEQIAADLRTDTKSMRPSMHKLIEAKKIKTEGQRRGMSYYPA